MLTKVKNYALRQQPKPYTKCTACQIRNLALFRGVPIGRLEWTQQYRETQVTIEPRKQIYLEKIEPDYAFTVFSGWVSLYKTLDNGQRQILRIALPGDLLGLQRSSDGSANHSAEALTSVTLCAFPIQKMNTLVCEQPEVAARLVEITSRDMAICQQHLVCAGKKDARQRIAYLLMETFHRVRKQVPSEYREEDNSIFFPITQEDIGDTVGLTNVHVNRTIKQLQNEGLLSCHHRRLSILNEKQLSEIGQFDPASLEGNRLIK